MLVTTQYVGEAEQCDAVLLISDGRVIAAGTPEELRRAAIGGDIVEVETAAPLDAGTLRTVDGILRIEQHGPTEYPSDGRRCGEDTLGIADAITAAGGDVRPRRRRGPPTTASSANWPSGPGPSSRRPRTTRSKPPDAGCPANTWRLLAFVGKELVETARRPGAIVSPILGPFLIMAVFGGRPTGIRRQLEIIVVVLASSELPGESTDYQELAGPALHIAGVVR